ncbi:MAG: helix-turn-helix domain-containing protein [Magnetospirillum sp.]|nr:helix-turn-helix domain-containing protein [Magnetospirillum sp.]
MDLFQLMDDADGLRDKALDRLEGIVALYRSDDPAVREEAMGRAMVFCGKEWGGYAAGLEALADRCDSRDQSLMALCLREEAQDPGSMIRQTEAELAEQAKMSDEKRAVIARYGSEEAALGPTPLERMFVDAVSDWLGDPELDPWAPIAGWAVPWHPLPDELAHTVAVACPMPQTIADARAECMAWESRLAELDALGEGPGGAVLPTACAARHRLVQLEWAATLPVRSLADFQMRLEYWRSHGGDDGAGYARLEQDFVQLLAQGVSLGGVETTKDKCRRLKLDNPKWSLARIGQELGISRQAVHKHLKA